MRKRIKKLIIKMDFLGARVFMGIVVIGLIVGLIIPLRPTESKEEQRKLTTFPEFSISSFLDGSYTSAISDWYSDTYPLRSFWININDFVQNCYGIRSVQVTTVDADMQDNADILEDALANQAEEESSEDQEALDAAREQAALEAAQAAQAAAINDDEYARTDLRNLAAAEVQENLTNGLIVVGNVAFGLYYFNQAAADDYINIMNYAVTQLPEKTHLSVILPPASCYFYLSEEVVKSLYGANVKNATTYYHNGLDSSIGKVDVIGALEDHTDQYLYFRTDHHWTSLAAWYAYDAWSQIARGEPGDSLANYEQIVYEGFLGSFYTKTKSAGMKDNPDTVTCYVPTTTNMMELTDSNGNTMESRIIKDASEWDKGNLYLAFISGDNPKCVVNNPNVHNGKTCILVKDSYGNCFAPFLVDDYEKLIILDYRKYDGNVIDLCRTENADELIFVTSMGTISSEAAADLIGSLVY